MVEYEFPYSYEVELAKTRNSREDKIVFSYSQEDFDYCHNPEEILSILVYEVNEQLASRGVNIEVEIE